jgi:hypothetical protein
MTLYLDVYIQGCEPEPLQAIDCRSTREGIAIAKRRAARELPDYGHEDEQIVRVYPADDDIVSFGYPDCTDYVTLRVGGDR